MNIYRRYIDTNQTTEIDIKHSLPGGSVEYPSIIAKRLWKSNVIFDGLLIHREEIFWVLSRTQEVDSSDSTTQNVLIWIAGRNMNTHDQKGQWLNQWQLNTDQTSAKHKKVASMCKCAAPQLCQGWKRRQQHPKLEANLPRRSRPKWTINNEQSTVESGWSSTTLESWWHWMSPAYRTRLLSFQTLSQVFLEFSRPGWWGSLCSTPN